MLKRCTSFTLFCEFLANEKAIDKGQWKERLIRKETIDQGVRDGSRSKGNQGVRDGARINRTGSNERSDRCYQRWIREQAIDQDDKSKEAWIRKQ